MAEDIEIRGRSRVLLWIGLLAFGLPLLYVLSIGPVALVLEKTDAPMADVELAMTFYAPVDWLYSHTILQKPLKMYLQLWGVK